MTNVTQILSQIESGDPAAADQLLPLVYDELRKLAAAKLVNEKPGQTLQATALVHEAYLRLVDVDSAKHWESRGHFFAAAAESMRRILVENARRKKRIKHGGEQKRLDLDDVRLVTILPPDELLLLNDSIESLAAHDPSAAELVKLRYFVGMTVEEAADAMHISAGARLSPLDIRSGLADLTGSTNAVVSDIRHSRTFFWDFGGLNVALSKRKIVVSEFRNGY